MQKAYYKTCLGNSGTLQRNSICGAITTRTLRMAINLVFRSISIHVTPPNPLIGRRESQTKGWHVLQCLPPLDGSLDFLHPSYEIWIVPNCILLLRESGLHLYMIRHMRAL
nr:hypothetical protein Itr_chr11CG20620 [Ipomoea trifida]